MIQANLKYKKPLFGHGFYQSPSNETLMKKIKGGKVDKEQTSSFLEQHMKSKKWIPGPVNYIRTTDWSTVLPKDNGKFKKSPRVMISTEIIKNNAQKEKSSPGPAAYN